MPKANAVPDRKKNVPTPVPPKQITQISQEELVEFIAIKNQIEKLETDLKHRAESLKELLQAGVQVEPGVHVASVDTRFRTNVSWKTEAIALADKVYGLGERVKWEAEVRANTPATGYITLDVH